MGSMNFGIFPMPVAEWKFDWEEPSGRPGDFIFRNTFEDIEKV